MAELSEKDRTCGWCGTTSPDSETAQRDLRPVTETVILCFNCKPKVDTTAGKMVDDTHAKILELSDLMWSLVGPEGTLAGGVSEHEWARVALFPSLLKSMAEAAENMLLQHMPPEVHQRAADIIVNKILESPPEGMTLPPQGVQVMTMSQFIERHLK